MPPDRMASILCCEPAQVLNALCELSRQARVIQLVPAEGSDPVDSDELLWRIPTAWSRSHSNGWYGWVRLEALVGNRYVAAAAPLNDSRSASVHVTPERAMAASDASVHETGHACDRDCTPWLAER